MTEHVPLDPFASLNLSEFKARQSKTPAPQKLDKEADGKLAAINGKLDEQWKGFTSIRTASKLAPVP